MDCIITMFTIETLPSTVFSGRRFTRKQLTEIRDTVKTFWNLSRKELAFTLCEHLNWKNPAGKPKVDSCLVMLERLETLGIVTLPQKRKTKSHVRRVPAFDKHPEMSPIEGQLAAIGFGLFEARIHQGGLGEFQGLCSNASLSGTQTPGWVLYCLFY